MAKVFYPVRLEDMKAPAWHPRRGMGTIRHRRRPVYAPVGGRVKLWQRVLVDWPFSHVILPLPAGPGLPAEATDKSFVMLVGTLQLAKGITEGVEVEPGQYLGVSAWLDDLHLQWVIAPSNFEGRQDEDEALPVLRECQNPFAWAAANRAAYVGTSLQAAPPEVEVDEDLEAFQAAPAEAELLAQPSGAGRGSGSAAAVAVMGAGAGAALLLASKRKKKGK